MKTYIGTKLIRALPMTRAKYNEFRGWELPADENGDDAGYLVEYLDGGKPNTKQYAGYVSWSPAEQFDKAYRPTTSLTFGMAIDALKRGHCVTRQGWNGKDMYLYLVRAKNLESGLHPDGDNEYGFVDVVAMKTAHDVIQVGWLATQTDMLGEDWQVLA